MRGTANSESFNSTRVRIPPVAPFIGDYNMTKIIAAAVMAALLVACTPAEPSEPADPGSGEGGGEGGGGSLENEIYTEG